MDNNDSATPPPSDATQDALRDPSTAYKAAATNRKWVFTETATGMKRIALLQRLNQSQLRADPFNCGHHDTWLSPQAVHLVNLAVSGALCLDCLLKEITQLIGAEIHPEFHTSKAEFFADTLEFGLSADAVGITPVSANPRRFLILNDCIRLASWHEKTATATDFCHSHNDTSETHQSSVP